MPYKALVAFGVALACGLSSPTFGWGLEPDNIPAPNHQQAGTTPQQNDRSSSASGLALEDALARSLAQNPELAAKSLEVEIQSFEATQAGLLPNPELSFEVENFAGSGAFSGSAQAEMTLALSQKIELGGKRRNRLSIARLDRELAEREQSLTRTALITETRVRFVAVLAAQEQLALAADQATLTDRILASVDERISSGKSARIERLRLQSLQFEAQLRAVQAEQELLRRRQALAELWGSEAPDFDSVHGDFAQIPELPDWARLNAMLTQTPAFAYEQTLSTRSGQVLALEESRRLPDLTVSLGGKRFEENDDHAVLAGLSFDLPLFDRNQAAVQAARVGLERTRATVRAARLQLRAELGALRQRLLTAHAEATLLRETLLPALQQSFDAVTYGYRAGKFGYLEVLDAERALFAARSRYIASLQSCHQAYAELAGLFSGDLENYVTGATDSAALQRG